MAQAKLSPEDLDKLVNEVYDGMKDVSFIPPALIAVIIEMIVKFIASILDGSTKEERKAAKEQRKKYMAVWKMARKQEKANHKAALKAAK